MLGFIMDSPTNPLYSPYADFGFVPEDRGPTGQPVTSGEVPPWHNEPWAPPTLTRPWPHGAFGFRGFRA